MNSVFVVSSTRQPLMPTSPVRARLLLAKGKAAVIRRYPFTIILKEREVGEVQPLRLKVDPGSKETGIAIVHEITGKVVFAAVLVHRGLAIKAKLDSRRALRRGRRSRNLRYRAPRFDNRTRPAGWLAPSLQHRVATVVTWVTRLRKVVPVGALSMELVRFDLQKIEHPEIAGIEYQQGELAGYEVREYLLEKWGRKCAYCGAEKVPLQVEHIVAKAKGGTDRVSNLCIACSPCNTRKGTQDIAEFLKNKPEILKQIQAQAKRSLKDAAAVNSTRWALFGSLESTGIAVEVGSGGRTKYNRVRQSLPKEHWIDAACVGASGELVVVPEGMRPLIVKAAGHGNRQMCAPDAFGFPKRHRTRLKHFFGFQTGDMVRAVVPGGKKQGVHVGRLLVRATGSFDIQTKAGRVAGVSHRHCIPIHRKDGYAYQ